MDTWYPAPKLSSHKRRVVLLPIGSCEQHGPYLPIDTDLRIAQLIAEKTSQLFQASDIILLPAIPFSASWEHKGIGTISLNISTLGAIIHDIAKSLKSWNMPVLLILINWHGGNSVLSSLAAEITATEAIPTATLQTIVEAGHIWYENHNHDEHDIHAGALETSIIKAYWPEIISEQIPPEAYDAPEIKPVQTQTAFQALGIRAITREGIWGNPASADPQRGKYVVEAVVQKLHAEIAALLELVNKEVDS